MSPAGTSPPARPPAPAATSRCSTRPAARIGNSLDLETTARELLDVAVPGFCDLASVDLYQGLLTGDDAPPGSWDSLRQVSVGGSAELRRVALASAVADALPDTAAETGSPELGSVHRFSFNSPCAIALRTGHVENVPGDDRGFVQSTLAVPMVAHDTVVGLVQFSRTKGSEPFGERDRALATELAARAAVCIDNARLYRREHERALILQRSLLPPGDPVAAGLDIACRYLPGNTATEVGGDWFDVIELPGHRTALVVGDVMGRGLRAAVAMGELRTAVRTLALLDLEPAEVLSALDEVARGLGTPGGSNASGGGTQWPSRAAHKSREADLSEVYLATCVYAVYDPVTRRCTFANAGHLPPAVVEPGEAALLLDVPPGMPLGVGGEPFEEVEVELKEGSLLALYTDGLVESRDHPLDEGLQALRAALVEPERPIEDVCDHVLTTLDTGHGEDDIALLVARIQGLPADAVGDWRLPREPRSVGRARELARGRLLAWGLDDLVDTTELLVSELVTNALRYGEGEIRLRLLRDRTLVCEVWDAGLVQPRRRRARDTDEGGRGLQLVGLLSVAWGSRRTPRGKTVWFELALPDGELARRALGRPAAEHVLTRLPGRFQAAFSAASRASTSALSPRLSSCSNWASRDEAASSCLPSAFASSRRTLSSNRLSSLVGSSTSMLLTESIIRFCASADLARATSSSRLAFSSDSLVFIWSRPDFSRSTTSVCEAMVGSAARASFSERS